MKFIHSAFTENTSEAREWLEKLGYELSAITDNSSEYIKTQANGIYYITPANFWSDIVINCLGNLALFKAVTAMREDSDKYQWFYNEFGDWDLCPVDHLKFNDTHINGIRVWFKATLSELQEHFKRV